MSKRRGDQPAGEGKRAKSDEFVFEAEEGAAPNPTLSGFLACRTSRPALPSVVIDKSFPPHMQVFLEERANTISLPYAERAPLEDREKIEAILWYGHGVLDGAVMKLFPNLKVISNFGTGYEFIDAALAASLGIPTGHTPGCLSETVADFAWALLLASARDVVGGASRAAGESFAHCNPNDLGKQVSGASIGIVGMGSIGMAIAKRAAAFNMPVRYHNRSKKSAEEEGAAGGAVFCAKLEVLLAESDYVMLACPGTPATTHMMGSAQFAAMKPDAIFINIGRGVCVDQEALVAALTAGELARAAVDVTDPEPLPRDHPLVATAGTPLEGRVLVTPHQGSATKETRMRMMEMAVENLRVGLTGKKMPWTVPEAQKLFA